MSFNIQEMLEKAKVMQQEVENMKAQAKKIVVTGESGAGMVSVKMNGGNQVLAVTISPEVIDNNDVTMLQDLLVAAFNNAQKAVQDQMQAEVAKLSSKLPNIPGLNF
ncbi:MAG: YbaB/EbfC family nucleoid-associated protein [Candidatus Kapabacteria bacterium]|nr:YbaB/EbfC family nucleoid-associated protein [Candidatus Kapabacteria bacterium]